ncbi:MAG: deoxynucleoside kinase [Patescibacteria group bacterium]|nr:deoxynucleoside kinase [Patescibacteria group bacterium]
MLISLEGIAGSGKTTQIKKIKKYLEKNTSKKIFISTVYEGKRRKAVSNFMNRIGINDNQIATMFLFQTLHALQYSEAKNHLNKNYIVLADRWRYSFFEYHLTNKTFTNCSIAKMLDEISFKNLHPEIIILLDIEPKIAFSRYVFREKKLKDKGLKIVDLKYLNKASEFYKKISHALHWHIVDANRDEDLVFENIKKILDKFI